MRTTVLTLTLLIFLRPSVSSAQTFSAAGDLIQSQPAADIEIRGVALADFNSDGLVDIYHNGRLHRQLPDGTFVDVKDQAGITVAQQMPIGGAFGDINDDGLLDLMLLDGLSPARLYSNITGSRFILSTAEHTVNVPAPASDISWADFDLDGRLDIFVAEPSGRHFLLLQEPDGTFSNHAQRLGAFNAGITCGVSIADLESDSDVDLFATRCAGPGRTNILLENTGGTGEFQSRDPSRAGVPESMVSTGSVWLDYDNDGLPDLYVLNQPGMRGAPNQLYRSTGNGSFASPFFENVTTSARVGGDPFLSSKDAIAADFDNDGWMDLFIINEESNPKMFRNRGDGTFENLSLNIFERVPTGPVVAAGDINKDGWIDLVAPQPLDARIALNNGGSNHWLRIKLRQTGGNGFATGAQVRVRTGDLVQTKFMLDTGGTMLQDEVGVVQFGLGQANTVDQVTVVWPGGDSSTFTDVAADQEVQYVKDVGENNPPEQFDLLKPEPATFFETNTDVIRFEWEQPLDLEGDPLTYTISINGPGLDLSIPDLEEPFYEFDADLLVDNRQYTWAVVARDPYSSRSTQSQRQFSFGTPDVAQGVLQQPVIFDYSLAASRHGIVRFVDFDTDGDEDLFFAGSIDGNAGVRIFRNVDVQFRVSEDVAVLVSDFQSTIIGDNITALDHPEAAWSDLDGDGDLDAVMTGVDSESGVPRSAVYDNLSGQIVPKSGVDLPQVWGGVLSWTDFDGDGDPDLLIGGATTTSSPHSPVTMLLRNDDGTLVDSGIDLPGFMFASSVWGDIDGDGDPDLIVTGDPVDSPFRTEVYENTGGDLRLVANNLPGLVGGAVDLADTDDDGDNDLLLSGGKISPDLLAGETLLFHNDGNGHFSKASANLEGAFYGKAQFTDYEGDGDPDIFILGAASVNGNYVGRLYRNEDGRFAAELDVNGLIFSDVDFADYNGDGDEDFVLIGQSQQGDASVRFLINAQIPEFIPPQQQ